MIKCVNINHPEVKALSEQLGLPAIVIAAKISKWQELNSTETFPTAEEIKSEQSEVAYVLKSVNILQSDKAKQVFEKGNKNKWSLDKILSELQIPKEQKQLILDLNKHNREDIITDLLANYSYTIEINTAKKTIGVLGADRSSLNFNIENSNYSSFKHAYLDEFVFTKNGKKITKEEYDTAREAFQKKYDKSLGTKNTNYYSNLTVPGGTNYTENEIATPGQLVKEKPQGVPVKEGVKELFESNPELANTVYEALGFKSKPDVILPIGTSGSGKSTFIKSLPQENLVVIEPDAMRVEFTGNMNDKSKDKEIYIEAANRAVAAIKQGKQVVFDTTNLTKDKRLPFIEAIKKAIPNANIQYKLMELNPELAKQRIKAQLERGENRAAVSDETIDRHAASYKQMLEDIKSEPISNYEITPQQKQQAQQLYSQYLDTIFPDSKVKDIVYHYTNAPKFEKFVKDYIGSSVKRTNVNAADSELGIFFGKKGLEGVANKEKLGTTEIPALINIKNPNTDIYDKADKYLYSSDRFIDEQEIDFDTDIEEDEDGNIKVVYKEKDKLKGKDFERAWYNSYKQDLISQKKDGIVLDNIKIAFEPEQIHILGGKQDIEGFKSFIKSNTKNVRKGAITPSIKGHAQFSTENGIGWFRSDEQEQNNKKRTFKDSLPKFLQDLFDNTLNVELDSNLKNTASFEKITRNGKQIKRIALGKGAKVRDFLHEVIHSILDNKFSVDEKLRLRSRVTTILKRISELNEEDSAVSRMLNAYTGIGHSIEEEIVTWYLTQKAFRNEINNSPIKDKVINLIKQISGFTEEQIAELIVFDESIKSEESIEEFVNSSEENKTRRILEVQSDLFQQSRDKENLVLKEETKYNANEEDGDIRPLLNNDELEDFDANEFLYKNPSDEIIGTRDWGYGTVREDNENYYFESGDNKYSKISKEKYEQERIRFAKLEKEQLKSTREKAKQLKENKFLQLLNKDNNWVTFFVKSIIQDSAKKGYEKVLFPSGNTASKVEGHTTLEEFKKQKEDRIDKLKKQKNDIENAIKEHDLVKIVDSGRSETYGIYELDREIKVNYGTASTKLLSKYSRNNKEELKGIIEKSKKDFADALPSIDNEINQLKQELERVETEGFGALKPIYNFYENTVTNILKKQGYSPILITDEYGNTWNEINVNNIDVIDLSEGVEERSPVKGNLETNIGLVLPGKMSAEQQLEAVRFLVANVLNDVFNEGIDVTKSLKEWKEEFEALSEDGDIHAPIIVEAFSGLSDIVLTEVAKYKRIFEDVDVDDISGEISENNSYSEDRSITINHNEKIGPKLRKMFLQVPNVENITEEGKIIPRKNWFGKADYRSIDDTMNTLQAILVDQKPEYKELRNALTNVVDTHKWIKVILDHLEGTKLYNLPESEDRTELIEKFEKDKNQILNDFTIWATKHKVNRTSLIYSNKTISGNKEYILRPFNNNMSSTSNKVLEDLYDNLRTSKIVDVTKSGEVYIPKEKALAAYNEFQGIVTMIKNKAGSETVINSTKKWLSSFGIYLTDDAINKLAKDADSGRLGVFIPGSKKKLTKLNFEQHFLDPNGIFLNMANRFKDTSERTEEDTLATFNPLDDNSGIRNLVAYLSAHTDVLSSNSYRDGDKTIWSYSVNKHFTDMTNKIVNDKDYVDSIRKYAFQSNSYVLKAFSSDAATLEDKVLQDHFDYFYLSSLVKKKGKNPKEMEEMNGIELEKTRMGFFFNQGNDVKGVRTIKHIALTTSDKKTLLGFNMLAHTPNPVFKGTELVDIDDVTITKLVDIISSEYNRIREFESYNQRAKAGDEKAKVALDSMVSKYKDGAALFLYFPQLNKDVNTEYKIFDSAGNLVDFVQAQPELKRFIKDYTIQLVNNKLAEWKDIGVIKYDNNGNYRYSFIDKSYIYKVANPSLAANLRSPLHIVTFAALDYEVNNLINNHNLFQVFTGDPAMYFKKEKGSTSSIEIASDTFINVGKRLAAMIAPGNALANTADTDIAGVNGQKYIQLFAKDTESKSRTFDYLKALLGDGANDYAKIEATDAQEFTTVKEHLYVMFHKGKLDDATYKKLIDKVNKEGDDLVLTNEELGMVLQPEKPVHFGLYQNDALHTLEPVYIKTSSFPLLPQITKNLAIDGLRKEMERIEKDNNKPVRLVLDSGAKVGRPQVTKEVFDSNGNLVPELDFSKSMRVLDRYNFRIQQEVPFDPEKDAINRGSQEAKLLFTNILDIDGFEYKGKVYNGSGLKAEYEKLNKRLYEIGYEDFIHELNVTDINGVLYSDKTKLKDLLYREAKERNYPKNDLDAISEFNGDFLLPLVFNNSSDKFESLLLAIVDKKIRKKKLPGFSSPLGTEEGFITTLDKYDNKDGIVFLDGFNPKDGLKSAHMVVVENGVERIATKEDIAKGENLVVKPSQVIAPFKFRDNKGNLLNLKDFVKQINGKTVIDTDKLPKELLKTFGFRIPTQLHASMAMIEIVGFLPDVSGDLLIASKDFTKQMGSDFDIDKLYAYLYNTYYDKENKTLSKFTSDIDKKKAKFDADVVNLSTEDRIKKRKLHDNSMRSIEKKLIQNDLLDLHFSVMSNPKLQPMIAQALGFGMLKELASEINTAKLKNNKMYITPLSTSYQNMKYINARGGKAGTGFFSVANTFNTALQAFPELIDFMNGDNLGSISFGNLKSNRLTDPKTLSGKYKSEVHAAFQSAAVDNEKESILEKLNINSFTFDSILGLTQVGFDEDLISYLLNTPSVLMYIDKLSRNRDMTREEFVKETTADIVENIVYQLTGKRESIDAITSTYTDVDLNELKDLALGKSTNTKSNISALIKFLEADELGKALRSVASAINTDSAGLPKNFFESFGKENKVLSLPGNKKIKGAELLIGLFDEELNMYTEATSINGYATLDALFTANNVFGKEFPVNNFTTATSTSLIAFLSNVNLSEMGVTAKAKYEKEIWNELKSYIFTEAYSSLFNNPVALKERIFFGKNPLAARVKEFAATSKNPFIKRLSFEIDPSGLTPSYINFDSSKGENLDESSLYQGFIDLLSSNDMITEDYSVRNMAEDMVSYFYLSGGNNHPRSFGKYIPNKFLSLLTDSNGITFNVKLHQAVKELFGDKYSKLYNIEGWSYTPFVKQYFQHNPDEAPRVDNVDTQLSEVTEIEVKESKLIRGKSEEVSKKVITSFKVNSDSKLVIDISESEQIPYLFISINTGFNENMLYQLNPQTGKHELISTLGSSVFFKEYSFDNLNAKSSIKKNNLLANQIPVLLGIDNRGEGVRELESKSDNIMARKDVKDKYGIEDNMNQEELSEVLLNIANDDVPDYYKALATALSTALFNHNNVKFKHAKLDTHVMGRYEGDTDTIVVNKNYNHSDLSFIDTLLHESVHGVTSRVVKQVLRGKDFGLNITKDQKTAVLNIKNMYNKVRSMVLDNKLVDKGFTKEGLLEFEKQLNSPESRISDDSDFNFLKLKDKYYGISMKGEGSLYEEFITMSMTSPEFMLLLNDIKSGDKTFLQRLIENIAKIFKEYIKGFTINGNSVNEESLLYEALSDIMVIANSNNDNTDIVFNTTEVDQSPGYMNFGPARTEEEDQAIFVWQVEEFLNKHSRGKHKLTSYSKISKKFFEALQKSIAGKDKYNRISISMWRDELRIHRIPMVQPDLFNDYSEGLANTQDLGMTIGEFMQTLDKESRNKLRTMIKNNEIKTKCK